MAETLQRGPRILIRLESHSTAAFGSERVRQDPDFEVWGDTDPVAHVEPSGRSKKRFPFVSILQRAQQQDFRLAACSSLTEQSRRKDAAPVDHEQIAGRQQLGKITKRVVPCGARDPREHQQA
jgi:hypothetical protein